MNDAVSRRPGGGLLVSSAAFVIVVAGLKAAAPVIVPVLLAAFIAIISAPALFWLERRRVPKIPAFFLVAAAVVVLMVLFGIVLSTSAVDFARNLPEYQQKLHGAMNRIAEFAEAHGVSLSRSTVFSHVNPATVLKFTGTILGGLGTLLSQAVLIFLTVAFILFETSSFPRKLEALHYDLSNPETPVGLFLANVKKYLAIKTAASLATGLLIFLGLELFGLDYALLWGLLAFALNYIPSIGSIMAAAPPVVLALVQLNWRSALGVAALYLVVNSIIGNVIEPKYMGKGLGLSPLVVFLSLLFWGWVLGPVGMFLSVPLTMTAKIACDSSERTRPLGILLGP